VNDFSNGKRLDDWSGILMT